MFLLAVFVPLFASFASCSEKKDSPGWVEQREHIKVVRLKGTPYEMGRQHAELLYDELVEGRQFIDEDVLFSVMLVMAEQEGLIEVAHQNSYQSVIDECQGLVDGMDGVWTMDECLTLNYGDVVVEFLSQRLGCSQFVAAGPATAGGELIHGRNLDWWQIYYLEQNPVVFIREPDDGIPWVSVGFPANLSPYTGLNAASIAVASNEVTAPLDTEVRREGRSHVQMVREILRETATLEEAEAYIQAQEHASATILVVSDGVQGSAAVFELTAFHMGISRLSPDGIVYVANHFVHPDMLPYHEDVTAGKSTWNRHERLRQLLEPGEPDSLYGLMDTPGAISILRDTYNPHTGETLPPTQIDDGATLANNGAMQSVVFLPRLGVMYVAVGEFPATIRKYIGFNIHELLREPDATLPDPPDYPALDVQ
jgi:hypothetical protein